MKNFLLVLLLSLSGTMVYSQETCGFDDLQAELERSQPEVKLARENAERSLLQLNKQQFLNKIGATTTNGKYTGTIYEIPVVVHVIESTDPSNANLSLTDVEIQTWLENANQMYATTFGNGYYAEGNGLDGGTVIPFRLVLAKRTQSCESTSGIIRYDGSAIFGSEYDEYGIKRRSTNGIDQSQVRSLIPHWSENSYFNIYIPIAFDGDKTNYGLTGYAGFPTNPSSSYDSFMKAPVVTKVNNSTLAHELGHAFGLEHPFKGANSSGGECPANTGDCMVDDDRVCDTASTQSLLSVSPVPSNSDINVCTGVNYEGVQYNIMNYTKSERKFTPGQRERAIAIFMQLKGSLTQSLGSTSISEDSGGGTLLAASCIPQGISNPGDFQGGPIRVQLGGIDNSSQGYNNNLPEYYVDYSKQNCINPTVYTEIPKDSPSTIIITFRRNNQRVKAWIDYNNDGAFDNGDQIADSNGYVSPSDPFSVSFTPPSNAITNTPLRMRVLVDAENLGSCENLYIGQIEDYTVRITPDETLSSIDKIKEKKSTVVYMASQNKLLLIPTQDGQIFGEYKIYDMNGKLIQIGKSNNREISINSNLLKGVYIINYNNGKDSTKFHNSIR